MNPACLVHPEANECKPGDGFSLDDSLQREDAQLFLARHPFMWSRPPLGQALSIVSQSAFGLLFVLIALQGWVRLQRCIKSSLNPQARPRG
jgi:hypothetical protein